LVKVGVKLSTQTFRRTRSFVELVEAGRVHATSLKALQFLPMRKTASRDSSFWLISSKSNQCSISNIFITRRQDGNNLLSYKHTIKAHYITKSPTFPPIGREGCWASPPFWWRVGKTFPFPLGFGLPTRFPPGFQVCLIGFVRGPGSILFWGYVFLGFFGKM